MKKIIVLILTIALAVLSSCSNNQNTLLEENTSFEEKEVLSTNYTEAADEATKNDVTYVDGSDTGGGEIVQQKYRQCYYNISYQLALLVDEEELEAWEEETYAKDPNETNEMVVKLFVQHFDISKEDFERANLESAKVIYDPNSPPPSMNPKDYINQEMYEIYNADIIYTFDDEIINNYYLSGEYPYIYESEYEEAVANGEYISQTEVWIDIEQMEAEIIAKYGETEIVTEISTAIPEEEKETIA